jgi:putative endonuclease
MDGTARRVALRFGTSSTLRPQIALVVPLSTAEPIRLSRATPSGLGWTPEVVTMRATDALGEYGERLAARYLCQTGMQILARRWRCRHGELDIIALDGSCLVVCEVKTRRSLAAGTPLDAVTPAKVTRLHRLAAAWLAEQDQWYPQVRLDVVAVTVPRRGAAQVEHLKAVI